MIIAKRLAAALAVVLGTATAAEASAQSKASHLHIGHVVYNWAKTPGGIGLLTAAEKEVEIAIQHARLANENWRNLKSMKNHIQHVLHALDPDYVAKGPGTGFGLIRAAGNAAKHIRLAASSADASEAVKTHAKHVSAAAQNAAARGDRIIGLSRRVTNATSSQEAHQTVKAILDQLHMIKKGFDVDSDGKVTWDAPEGGLAQARQHINLMLKAEGLL